MLSGRHSLSDQVKPLDKAESHRRPAKGYSLLFTDVAGALLDWPHRLGARGPQEVLGHLC